MSTSATWRASSRTDKITHPIGTGPYQFVERVPGPVDQADALRRLLGRSRRDVKDVTYVYRAEPAVRAGMIDDRRGPARDRDPGRGRDRATTGRSPTRTTASS